MTTMTATYDDGFLFVLWTAPGTLEDFGVPRSPRWYSPVDYEAEPSTICVMGEEMEYDWLPKYMRDAIDATYGQLEWVVD